MLSSSVSHAALKAKKHHEDTTYRFTGEGFDITLPNDMNKQQVVQGQYGFHSDKDKLTCTVRMQHTIEADKAMDALAVMPQADFEARMQRAAQGFMPQGYHVSRYELLKRERPDNNTVFVRAQLTGGDSEYSIIMPMLSVMYGHDNRGFSASCFGSPEPFNRREGELKSTLLSIRVIN
jgi:hypothetical protein